jgi:hypothetical protein
MWHAQGRRKTCRVFGGKPEGKRAFGKAGHRREVNIKMNLQEMRYDGMDRINVARSRDREWGVGNMVMNLGTP